MNKRRICRRLVIFVTLSTIILMLSGCGPDIPEECGENIKTVVSIDFSGPSVIKTTPDYDFAVYDVTITVEKEDESKAARVCYAVRDDDPWWFDDVLDAYFMVIPVGENTRTLEGQFVLWAKDDDNICGAGSLPGDAKVEGCSGENEAEVYLQPIGSGGSESPRHTIRLGQPPTPTPPPGPCPSGQKCCGSIIEGECIGQCWPEENPCP